MISHPIIYVRDFQNDVPRPVEKPYARALLAALPLLALYRPLRNPLSCGMSLLRSATHFHESVQLFEKGKNREAIFQLVDTGLAVAAVGLFFFHPVLSLLATSSADMFIHLRTLFIAVREAQWEKGMETLAWLFLDALFIVSICHGSIEITVACMLLQIALDFYLLRGHFLKGDFLQGISQLILATVHLQQVAPQIKVLKWKWVVQPECVAELKQAKNGFIYLDIPDEYLSSLIELCDDPNVKLPPYFGSGKAGAHVSVILSDEMHSRPGFTLPEIGKKFSFRITHMEALKPDDWNGVDKVYFLALSSPELEALRSRHHFSSKIMDHDFHLTFGIKNSAPAFAAKEY
jgi:hypothetical protein